MRIRAIEQHLKWGQRAVLASLATVIVLAASGCFGGHHKQRGANLLDDKVTASRVESALQGGGTNQFAEVHVASTNGVITLSGSVGSEEQKEKAERLATGVHRVHSVKNEIAVKSQ